MAAVLDAGAVAAGFPTEVWTLPRVEKLVRERYRYSNAWLKDCGRCGRKYALSFVGTADFFVGRRLAWCDAIQVDYILGAARNRRLEAMGKGLGEEAEKQWDLTKCKQRLFQEFLHKARSWDRKRRFIHKAEHTAKGANPRFIVTSLQSDPQELYDKVYCARGEMENRIKEQQLGLFADRTSCGKWWANQFRLPLSACAYVLMETIRRVGLKGSELARAQVGTIRLKLLKHGTVIIRNTRRIRLLFSSG